MTSFVAQISDWVHETEGAAEAVFKASVDDLLEIAQRDVPVDTGFLRGSLTIGINAEPADFTSIRPGSAYQVELEPAELGDRVMARWIANYATYVEHGARGRAGVGFVRKAAQQWSDIVKRNEARLGARLGR